MGTLSPQTYANSKHSGVAMLQIVADPREPRAAARFVPLRRTVVNGRWAGPLADITVTHTFGYTRAQLDRTLEAVYRFPLPGDAAVRRVVVTFGHNELVAELKERGEAEEDYAEARKSGQQAALVTRESPDVFTLRVTGLRPDEDIVIDTTYAQLARPAGAGWTLRIPLTIGPRFTRGDEAGTPAAKGQPLTVARDPGHRFALDLLTTMPGAIASSTHALTTSDEAGATRVQLRAGELTPDRDCVLSWQPTQQADRPTLHVLLGEDKPSGQTYFLALVSPPAAPRPEAAVPREAVILVDHSGSMSGAKWQAADWATIKFLGDLREHDVFNLGVFHDTATWLHRAPALATRAAVQAGERFVKTHTDSGGTELGVALEQALRQRRAAGDLSRQLVIVTDAEVTDSDRILALVRAEAKEPERRRVSVLCIDAAPNSYLTNEVTRIGGGIARYLTSDPEQSDITTALDDILAGWVQPVLTGLRLEVNRPTLEAPDRQIVADHEAGLAAVDLGDLVAGRSTWVAGRVPTNGAPELTFRLVGVGNQPIDAARSRTTGAQSSAIRALFGAWRVLGLEWLQSARGYRVDVREGLAALGYDADAVLASRGGASKSMYAENEAVDLSQRLHELLVRESLDAGVLCSATGFVAVHRVEGKQIEGTAIVPNALPSGWDQTIASNVQYGAAVAPAAPAPALKYSWLPEGSADSPVDAMRSLEALSGAMADVGMAGEAPAEPPATEAGGGILSRAQRFLFAMGPESPGSVARSRLRPAARSARARRPAGDAEATNPALSRGSGGFRGLTLFAGTLPAPTADELTLFDSASTPVASFAALRQLAMLGFEFVAGAPADLDANAELRLYVDDLAEPVVRVRLLDVVRQGGVRPLNVAVPVGARVVVVLAGATGGWAALGLAVRLAVS